MEKNTNFNYKNLSPFKWFILENFPFIEADFDALTEWQLFCKIGKEINKIIDSQNIVGEQAENLTNAFNELQNYINNYFNNLDVQEEINNKLNEMAENGTLEEIISKYITVDLMRTFNTFNDLLNDDSLKPNNKVNVIGKNSINDGSGSLFYIRNKLENDVESNNLLFLKNNLVAQKINNYAGTTTKKLFGNFNNACIQNINNSGIPAQIMGFNNENQLATYKNRDQVISYKEFRTTIPNFYAIVSVTETSVILTDIPKNIEIGSIIDLYPDNNFNINEKYSGFVTSFNEKIINVNHWYKAGNTDIGQIPNNVSLACIDMPSKVWVNNDNLLLTNESNVNEGVIAEYGLFNYKNDEKAKANGIDIVNFEGKSDFAYSARNDKEDGIYAGFFATNLSNAFIARNCKKTLQIQNENGQLKFEIDSKGGIKHFALDSDYILYTENKQLLILGNGQIQTVSYKIVQLADNIEIDTSTASLFILTGSNSYTLKNGKIGQTIKLLSQNALNNITVGDKVKALEAHKCCELLWNGSSWIDISNTL